MTSITPVERAIIAATQAGLPLAPRPFAMIADAIGISEDAVLSTFESLIDRGIVRRIAAAPNHYALGMTANGMTVWDVDDADVTRLGAVVGALPFVTHCYRRPRALPHWRYNLFAMVHGASRQEVDAKLAEIAAILGPSCRASDMLLSKRILKKTGLRLSNTGG